MMAVGFLCVCLVALGVLLLTAPWRAGGNLAYETLLELLVLVLGIGSLRWFWIDVSLRHRPPR
jgi:hypothetical protein